VLPEGRKLGARHDPAELETPNLLRWLYDPRPDLTPAALAESSTIDRPTPGAASRRPAVALLPALAFCRCCLVLPG